jgi:hypothetical protein
MNNNDASKNQSLIRLSQAQLNILEVCPPQFKRLYLDQLGSPVSPEIQDNLLWGHQFHQLMQQHFLGLSLDSLLAEDKDLKQIVEALLKSVIQQHNLNINDWREAEHYRSLAKDNYLLTAIYDLLIITENQAQILDWKTYLQPQNKKKLENNWQTRLYLYLLAETSDYLPEQVSMTYWFVKIPHEPQFLTFNYNHKQHQKTAQDLQELLTNLDHYLHNMNENNIDFPHLENCQNNCPYYKLFYPESSLLDKEEKDNNDLLLMLNEIEEISI